MKIEPRDSFHMVWRKGTGEIHFQHQAYGAAVEEAKRLAKKVPQAQFFVLKAVNMFAHIDMETKISVKELIELPDAVIAQLSKAMREKILSMRKQIQEWNDTDTVKEEERL